MRALNEEEIKFSDQNVTTAIYNLFGIKDSGSVITALKWVPSSFG